MAREHGDYCFGDAIKDKKKLLISVLICVVIFVLELWGGLKSKSVSLTSDAFHLSTHVIAFGVSYWALGKPRRESYAILVNGIILIVISISIMNYSIWRLLDPALIDCPLMLKIATIGLFGNLGQMIVLYFANRKNDSIRSIFGHILSDASFSVVVILGGVSIYLTKFYFIDGILGMVFSVVICYGGWKFVKKARKRFKEKYN